MLAPGKDGMDGNEKVGPIGTERSTRTAGSSVYESSNNGSNRYAYGDDDDDDDLEYKSIIQYDMVNLPMDQMDERHFQRQYPHQCDNTLVIGLWW